MTLVERLGFAADDKLVILNCDDLGSSRAANDAIYEALESGAASSSTWMATCGQSSAEASTRYAGEDVGVHLTLNAEWSTTPWRPLTGAATLCQADGAFLPSPRETWSAASCADVAAECRAQIRAALDKGIDVSHLDSHMHVLMNEPRYARMLVALGAEFRVPVRIRARQAMRRRRDRIHPHRAPLAVRRNAARRGVLAPDRFVDSPVGSRARIEQELSALQPGVTEFLLHPAVDGPELRSMCPDWTDRVDDHDLLASGALTAMVGEAGAHQIGYRDLRALQRGEPLPTNGREMWNG